MLLLSPLMALSHKSSPNLLIAQLIGAIFLCPSDVIERWIPMMAPFPSSWEEIQNRRTVNWILEECWKNQNSGYEIQPTDEWIVNNQQKHDLTTPRFGIDASLPTQQDLEATFVVDKGLPPLVNPFTYGEITPLGARQLFGAMGLLQRSSSRSHPAHFIDLGSGTGKLVGQVLLELPKERIERATGVELSPSRHKCAILSKEALLQWGEKYYEVNRSVTLNDWTDIKYKLEFLQADLFDVDISTATHIYIASLCFPDNLLLRLEEKLTQILNSQVQEKQNQERINALDMNDNKSFARGKKSCLEWVATLRRFPNDLGGISPTTRFIEMSWTSPLGCVVYLYNCNCKP